MNGLSPNEIIIHLHIFDNSILTSIKIGLCLGFSNTYYVEVLYRFGKKVVKKVRLMKHKHSKKIKLNTQMKSFTAWY